MKKTIRDLKIGDIVYFLDRPDSVYISESAVSSISTRSLELENKMSTPLIAEDFTRFNFSMKSYYTSSKCKCVLDPKDLLKDILENAKNSLNSSIEEFSKYVALVQSKQRRFSEIEAEIFKTFKSDKNEK